MIRDALAQAQHVVREVTESGRSRQQRDIGQRCELRERRAQPVCSVSAAVRVRALVEQRSAERAVLVAEDHARAAAGCRQRSRNATGTSADHQHVAVRIALRVAVGIRPGWRSPEARGGADTRLVQRCQAKRGHMKVL